jgi:hypothetical protein
MLSIIYKTNEKKLLFASKNVIPSAFDILIKYLANSGGFWPQGKVWLKIIDSQAVRV